MTFFQRIKSPFAESAAADDARMQPRMRQVGDVLQERREDLGLDLDEIGAMLRIKPAYLAALEQGRSDDLPGPAYAIGFVRAYADFLGLDAEQVIARFKAEASGVTTKPDLALPVPLGERSLPGRGVVLVAFILALCGYGIWYYLSTEDRNRPERVAAVPAALQAPSAPVLIPPPTPAPTIEGTPTASPAVNPAPAAPATPSLIGAAPSAAAATLPAPAPAIAPQPAPSAAPPPASPVPKPTPPVAATPAPAAVPTAASKVSIRALADCWIQIRASDQSIVFSRILKSGEVYTVPSRPGLSMRTGNAGVLEIAIDGKPAPSIGGIGMLRRDVTLDPMELAAGTAVHG